MDQAVKRITSSKEKSATELRIRKHTFSYVGSIHRQRHSIRKEFERRSATPNSEMKPSRAGNKKPESPPQALQETLRRELENPRKTTAEPSQDNSKTLATELDNPSKPEHTKNSMTLAQKRAKRRRRTANHSHKTLA